MPLILDLMPLEEPAPEPTPVKTVVVRYGYLKQIGEFASDLTTKVGCGSKLVCRTERGTEICEMLTTTCGNGGCGKSVTREKMLEYIANSGGGEYPFTSEGRILRVATHQDLLEQEKLNEGHRRDLKAARDLALHYHLQMKVVDVEYLLGGERVLFYFTSEHRVDFRQMVRDLAHQLHTRIELRQVGARDEARITADYEKCGQHCCCKQFLKVLTPISMRSAKVQKATLDPAKISGRCGRLMCCLRYEDQTYEDLRKKLPKRNTRVKTEAGDAWVLDGQILTQLVMCQYDDGKRVAVPMELIQAFDQPKPKLPNGVTMQTPNDRMPEDRFPQGPGVRGPAGPGGPRRGPGGPAGPQQGGPGIRPPMPQNRGPAGPGMPGGPQQAQNQPGAPRPPQLPPRPGNQGGPRGPMTAPGNQGGPVNPPRPYDPIDDLIADAIDDSPSRRDMTNGAPPANPSAEAPQASPVSDLPAAAPEFPTIGEASIAENPPAAPENPIAPPQHDSGPGAQNIDDGNKPSEPPPA